MNETINYPRSFIQYIADCCEQLLCRYAQLNTTMKHHEFDADNPICRIAALNCGCPNVIESMYLCASALKSNPDVGYENFKFDAMLPEVLTILVDNGLKFTDLDGLITA